MMARTRLSWQELSIAAHVAAQRIVMNIRDGCHGKNGAPNDRGTDRWHLTGTRGEIAVAKVLNCYWTGATGRGHVDVAGCVEVYSIDNAHHHLIVHRDDKAPGECPWVLADCSALPMVTLRGWITTADAKRDVFWHKALPRPAWVVPDQALDPSLDTLKAWIARLIAKVA